jgi:histidinol phosphatase-like PHP family hydrolase
MAQEPLAGLELDDVAAQREPDVNGVISGLLRDLAFVQKSKHSEWGYKRAAATIARLDWQIPRENIPKIPNVGPSSLRVIREILDSGGSPLVERAVAESGRASDIERRRSLRRHFLSRAAALRILRTPSDAVGLEDYHGDLQMHSTWSDGVDSIADLAAAGLARGYQFIAITDHSRGLPIAGGLSTEAVAAQQTEISGVNASFEGAIRVLRGLETNINAEGVLDVTPEECRGLDIVLAAPHSKLRTLDDQTGRLVRAIETPGVHVLAHPRGRMSDSRGGLQANWEEVFAAAAAAEVAIELDGDPARQDLDWSLAARALQHGCVFAVDSDAHSGGQLTYAETALAHARLAGIPASRVINSWPVEQLTEWLKR